MDVRLQLSSVEVHEVCQSEEGSEGSGLGVKSQTVTVDHLLLGYLMLVTVGLLSVSSNLSTKWGSLLVVQTNHFNSMGSDFIHQDGSEFQWEVHLWILKKCSWGGQLLAVHNRDQVKGKACDKTCSQSFSVRFINLRFKQIVFYITPIYHSACPLPQRWYVIKLLVATPLLNKYWFNSHDTSEQTISEWI